MCGIGGIFGPGMTPSGLSEAIRRLTAALHHRGPDACAHTLMGDPQAPVGALGATRLAILDPSPAGHQPMHDARTGNWVALNGEIYNHLGLRQELDDPGEPWRSGADTETVLRAYRRWGPGCVERLRGMFALAIWDAADGSLWCARDRLGIKPLYLAPAAEAVVFASEVRAILATGLVPASLDHVGLAGYLRFGCVPEPNTLFEGIASLGAGQTIRIRDGRLEAPRPYWSVESAARGAADRSLVKLELERAVREHLLSDVPVACLLSGGIDSAVVVALAARAGQRVHAFTFGFDDVFDESEAAAETARWVGAEHRVLRVSREDVARDVPAAVNAMDLPTADGVNTWVISRAIAAEGYKVVLSGLGGDEVFGGYPSFRLLPRLHRWRALLGRVPQLARRLAGGGGGRGGRLAAMTDRRSSLPERYEQLRALWSDDELANLQVASRTPLTELTHTAGLSSATFVSILELSGYMRSTLLRDSDVMSMAHSLELRVPLLDHELVTACLRAGVAADRPPKAALLAAVGDAIPPGVGRRTKRGFALPMDAWMRGPLATFVEAGLDATSRRLPATTIAALRASFHARKVPWARLWSLAVLGHWLERHRLT